MACTRQRRGFAIRDLAAIGACVGVGVSLMIPLVARGEIQSRLQVCMSRLKSIGMSRASYGMDHADSLASLQSAAGQTRAWRLGTISYSNTADGERQSVADQAIDIIRFRGNRPDIQRIVGGWMPSATFSHLALVEYRHDALPSQAWACPEDEYLLAWQANPTNFNNLGVPSPVSPGPLQNIDKRWPYISSYMMGTSSWANDRHSSNAGAWYFGGSSTVVRLGGLTSRRGDIGYRRLSEVAFPSAKIDMWDRGARHFGQNPPRGTYWGFVNAKQPALFFDGVVRTVRTGATDPGWDYNAPDSNRSYQYSDFYSASSTDRWRPGPPQGGTGTFTFQAAYFAATRNGLAGRDLP